MTRKLLIILMSLIFMLVSYIFIIKFDVIVAAIENIVYDYNIDSIVIPESNQYKRNYTYETFTMAEDYKPYGISDIKRMFYTILNNGWDSFTFYCPADYENCASEVKEVADDEIYISLLNNYVSPYNSFINFNTMITGDRTIYITIDKLYNEVDIKDSNEKLDQIFSDLKINKDSYKTEDIKRLHDYMLMHTVYNKNYIEGDYFSPSNKATGVFLEGEAVCSGYADAFALMMDRIGIPNFKVSSTNHIWNVIYINNKWLHIDATWDDDENNAFNRDNFFMITTDKLYDLDTVEHTFDESLYLELK